jgi:hypothetical protein
MNIEWTKEKPKKSGLYWFYGDIWWGSMNQSPEDFESELRIVKVEVWNKNITYICDGNFAYQGYGLYSKEPIEIPVFPDIEKPNYNG